MCNSIGILYHESDSALVTQIVDILEGPFFTQCFFAGRDMVKADSMTYVFDFLDYILSKCRKFVIVLSDNFFSSRETRLDLMSFFIRFDQGNCKVSFITVNGKPNIPYRRLLAMEKSKTAKFISAIEYEEYFSLVKAINRVLSDEAGRISEFPLNKYKFVFGSCKDGDVHEGGPTVSDPHVVLDVQNTVVTFKAGSKKAILGEGVQLCSSGNHDFQVVVERMYLSAEVMKSVTDSNPAFAPLISSVTPLYFFSVNPARNAENGSSSKLDHPELQAQLQLWSLRDSKASRNYRVMFSESVNFFGGNWCDATDRSLCTLNGKAACFELVLNKYGVYLLCEVDQSSLEDMTKVSCILQAMSDYLSQNYQRFSAMVSSDRRKVTFCAMRPSNGKYLNAVCTTESRWHRQAFIRVPKSTIRGTLNVIIDIEAGCKRMCVPATFDLHKQSVICKILSLRDICHQAKITCCITEKKDVVFEFKYQMASRFLRSPELTRSLMASSISCKGDCNQNSEYEESSSRRKHSIPDLDARARSLLKYGSRSPWDRGKKERKRDSNESPKYNPDGVITARHLTKAVSVDDEGYKAIRQLIYP